MLFQEVELSIEIKVYKKMPLYDFILKFIYSEKATKFCKISTLLLTGTTEDKSKVDISQTFVAFSEYMNFNEKDTLQHFQIRENRIRTFVVSVFDLMS